MAAPQETAHSDADRWLYFSLHSLYLFHRRNLLTNPLYYTAKHLLLSQADGTLAAVLKGYFGASQLSSESLDLSLLHEKVVEVVHSFVKRSLEDILEGSYSIERAHVHANNFKQHLYSSGSYKGELSFLKETKSLIYGEVEYESFSKVLLLALKGMSISADTFVDLGSGCGKAVLVAKAIANFKKLVGVEIVNELYDVSTQVVEAFYSSSLSWQANCSCRRDAYNIQLVNCSFLDLRAFDWSDADVVFLNSTCFSVHLMRRVQAQAARRLKRGSRVITFTNEFTDRENFKIIFKERLTMSWGLATVYIHEKCTPSRREVVGPDYNDDDDDDGYNDKEEEEGEGEGETYCEDVEYRGDPESDFDPVAWAPHYSHDEGGDSCYEEEEEENEEEEDMYIPGSKEVADTAAGQQRGSKGSPPHSEQKGSKDSKGDKFSPPRDRKGSKDSYDFADDFDDMAADNEDSFFANEDADADSRSESSAGPPEEYMEYLLA